MTRRGRYGVPMQEHGRNASLTARHFCFSRSSLHVWLKRHRESGPRGLEDHSRRPNKVRQPTWTQKWEAAVLDLREANPRWGKDVLTVILRRDEGMDISVSMVGRASCRERV